MIEGRSSQMQHFRNPNPHADTGHRMVVTKIIIKRKDQSKIKIRWNVEKSMKSYTSFADQLEREITKKVPAKVEEM